ncbi:hypothetical protein SFRURICE_018599 [Spodoptera frugiperda]|nr:hypothetical protein SFRURICE_018599 [Spodoptera frugiperda]
MTEPQKVANALVTPLGPYYELLFPVSLRRELNCLANSYYEHYCQPVSGHVTTQTDFCTTFGWLAGVYAYYERYFDVSILMLVVKLRLSKQSNKSVLLAA